MQDWQEEIEPLKIAMISIIQDWCESPKDQAYSFDYALKLFDNYLARFSFIEQKKVAQALLESKIFDQILLKNEEENVFFIIILREKKLIEDKVLREQAVENFSSKGNTKRLNSSECSHFTREVRCCAYDKTLRIS